MRVNGNNKEEIVGNPSYFLEMNTEETISFVLCGD
jgi:hypothetical protein